MRNYIKAIQLNGNKYKLNDNMYNFNVFLNGKIFVSTDIYKF